MNTRFFNGRILTMDNSFDVTENELWVENHTISYIGKEKKSEIKFDREIDLNGNLIMPTFKNAHTHSAMTFLRSYADDMPLQDWLFKQVFPMEEKLTSDDVYTLTKLAFLEYLTSGIGACFDMYFFPESVAKATEECGIRTVFCGSVSGGAENLERLENYYSEYNNRSPLIQYKLGFHAEYTADLDLMKGIGNLAEKHNAPVFVHNSETKKEVDECIARHGKTPTELFDSLGIYNYGGAGFHCVHMSENDLKIFKEKGVFAVTNPGSNSKLASGIAEIDKMNKMGIKIAIGTDGPASNNCLDMFKEMFLTTSLQKLKSNDASTMDGNDVLKMATVTGANCMGLSDCDVLAVGKRADIIEIDLHQPNMQPINNITKNIVYSGSKQNVRLTMVNGKILYENNKFKTLDAEEIYHNANKIIQRMI